MKRVRAFDVALVAAAIVIGIVHLAFPYGREHAHVAYAGREWLLHGAAPYNRTFVGEGPALVLVAGLAAVLGGGKAYVLRLFSLLAVVATGPLAARAMTSPAVRARVPVAGFAALAASVFAHGAFDSWDAARGGTFHSLAVVAALAALRSKRSWGLVIAGAATALVWLLRPTGLPVVALLVCVALASAGGARALGAFVAGALAVVVVFALALGPHAVADGYDLLVDGACLFAGPEREDRGAFLFTSLDGIAAFGPQSSIFLLLFMLGIGLALARGDRERVTRRAVVVAVGLATVAGVLVLRRYYFDFESATAFVALVAASIADDVALASRRRAPRVVAGLAFGVVALFAGAVFVTAPVATGYARRVGAALARATGRIDDATYAATFDRPEIGFVTGENAIVAHEVRRRTQPTDTILVRGFDPELYLAAGRSAGSRFVVTTPLVWNTCTYRRAEWLVGDVEEIRRDMPKVVVAIATDHGPDSPRTFFPLGYRVVLTTAHYVVLERP